MHRSLTATGRVVSESEGPLLAVDDIYVHFSIPRGLVHSETLRAVDGVSFGLARKETLGLVGESGSGKSTTGRAIVLAERLTAGEIRFAGQRLSELHGAALRNQRRHLQMIFQDPYSSLNPRHTIGTAISEPLVIHGVGDAASRVERMRELLDLVGLAGSYASQYPHSLSGGQRQRVAIARSLAAGPELVVCDEAVSSLDVSVQAQIVNLLKRLQEELGLALLFIAHDLAVVRNIAHRVAVMYLGKIVEIGRSEAVYARPLHPYTRALLSAVPVPDARIERKRRKIVLEGDLPNPIDPPSGCRFRTRCPWARERCAVEPPPLRPTDDGRLVACHFFEEIEAEPRPGLGALSYSRAHT
jgi:oligopeptide transport system ATP-binding protein